MYPRKSEILNRARKVGLIVQDLADAIGEPRTTTSNRLNGWMPLDQNQRKIIEERIEQAEKEVLSKGDQQTLNFQLSYGLNSCRLPLYGRGHKHALVDHSLF